MKPNAILASCAVNIANNASVAIDNIMVIFTGQLLRPEIGTILSRNRLPGFTEQARAKGHSEKSNETSTPYAVAIKSGCGYIPILSGAASKSDKAAETIAGAVQPIRSPSMIPPRLMTAISDSQVIKINCRLAPIHFSVAIIPNLPSR